MTNSTRLGLDTLAAALALGAAGDLLLRATPWGLNVFLCTLGLVVAGGWLVRRRGAPAGPDAPWLALTAVLLGAAFVRRDAALLGTFDLLALAVTLALAAASAGGLPIRTLGLAGYGRAVVQTAAQTAIGGPLLVATDIAWPEVTEGRRMGSARAAGLGVVLAVPPLLVFGALFMAADPVFDRLVTQTLRFDLGDVVSHTFLFGLWAAVAAGYLRAAVIRSPRPLQPGPARPSGLGIVPVATALALIDGLFLVFVAVQLRYFFGGAELVERAAGLTYAVYARRGFLELVTASALVLPLLLGADWVLRAASPAHRRVLQGLAAFLLALLAVITASALERARLYVAEFGWSAIRLYATACMVYLVGLFAWLAATVLRDRPQRFAFGAFVQGLAVLGALHTLNPDAFIVRANLERPPVGRPFDAPYAVSLSADAVPVLLDALPRLPAQKRCDAASALLHRWGSEDADWRTWNWSRVQARRLVAEHRDALSSAACPPHDDSPAPPNT